MNEDRNSASPRASTPPGTLVYAIGDIHGQKAMLDDMIGLIGEDASRRAGSRRVLVFVGDYIDRGPGSAAVIDTLVRGLPPSFEVQCLMGNHEQALLDFISDPATLPHWLMNGAETTLRSYAVEPAGPGDGIGAFRACRDSLGAAIPASHRAFLSGLPLFVEIGDYLFVHAGIRPGVALASQSERDLLWIREGFLDSDADLGRVVVHGHTPGPGPVVRGNRICIDTGAWANGCLTAVRLEGTAHEFIQVRGEGASAPD